MKATQARIARLMLPKGYKAVRTSTLPDNHRVPGMVWTVIGPAWGDRGGIGSFGSGETKTQAIARAWSFIHLGY